MLPCPKQHFVYRCFSLPDALLSTEGLKEKHSDGEHPSESTGLSSLGIGFRAAWAVGTPVTGSACPGPSQKFCLYTCPEWELCQITADWNRGWTPDQNWAN